MTGKLPFRDALPRKPKITIHTSCKGRAKYVKVTLPSSLAAAKADGNCEVLLISYSSPDGLGDMVKKMWMKEIKSGLLTYYYIGSQKYFAFSHSRNLGVRLATGDIVINVDADIAIGPNYLREIRRLYRENVLQAVHLRGMAGWMAMVKQHVEQLGGYDERMDDGYGREDTDLLRRAEAAGLTVTMLEPPRGWRRLNHHPDIKDKYAKSKHERGATWRHTEKEHDRMSHDALRRGILVANQEKTWGFASAMFKNFDEVVNVG